MLYVDLSSTKKNEDMLNLLDPIKNDQETPT